EGELVLVDAGGEYGGYITDITRTWPVNGKFSPAQKELYEAVLGVQRSCISLCRQDANVSLDKLNSIAESGLKDALSQLGFDLSGKVILLNPLATLSCS
ncbi:MAG: DEAH-box RNA helicase prp16, partial [Chaenotheca gracillima]